MELNPPKAETAFPPLPPLDGLRAVAVLMVFFSHCGLDRLIPGGFGVTIFFFLSGYLITSLLRVEHARHGRIDIRAFYVRRTLRIMPPLYITMGVYLLVTALVWPEVTIPWQTTIGQMFFFANYVNDGFNLYPVWSLAVEEHFYLVFPLLFAVWLSRLPARRAAAIAAWACVAVLLIRIASVPFTRNLDLLYYYTHTRVDSILFGCVLALYRNPILDERPYRPRLWQLAAAVAVLILCLVVRDEVFRQTLRYSLQGAALFVVFAYALSGRNWLARLLSVPPLRLLARYSYTFYLIQKLVIGAIWKLAPATTIPLMIPAAFIISIAYCDVMYRLVERPLSRWRRAREKRAAHATALPDAHAGQERVTPA